MSRTITALFDSRADAEAARQRLIDAAIDVSGIDIVDQTTAGNIGATSYSTHENRGFWATLKDAFLPDEDRHVYEEGVRRGGHLLTASVGDHDADTAVAILDEANTVDIDARANEWRSAGWDYQAPAAATAATTGYDATRTDHDQSIPIVEETLRVGKREVGRGGVRVRSYVVEKPVTEQITLREENVSVERRPVTGGTVDADAFRDRTIEVSATAEEAVVGKEARVVEEVVVRKDVDTRTETVSDTVRHTEVDVDRDVDTSARAHSATGTGLAGEDRSNASLGDKVSGLASEGVGNLKQGIAGVTGSDSLRREGEAQERTGEQRQGGSNDRY